MPVFNALVRAEATYSELRNSVKKRHSSMVWWKAHFDIINRLRVDHECYRQRDGRTEDTQQCHIKLSR